MYGGNGISKYGENPTGLRAPHDGTSSEGLLYPARSGDTTACCNGDGFQPDGHLVNA